MKEYFDFDRIGKRLPYTAPDGFLDDLENSVMQRIKQEVRPLKPKRNLHLWYSVAGGLVAAGLAQLIVFAPFHTQTKKSFEDVEEAFAKKWRWITKRPGSLWKLSASSRKKSGH